MGVWVTRHNAHHLKNACGLAQRDPYGLAPALVLLSPLVEPAVIVVDLRHDAIHVGETEG